VSCHSTDHPRRHAMVLRAVAGFEPRSSGGKRVTPYQRGMWHRAQLRVFLHGFFWLSLGLPVSLCLALIAPTQRHSTQRHATQRNATQRHSTPRHSTLLSRTVRERMFCEGERIRAEYPSESIGGEAAEEKQYFKIMLLVGGPACKI
jgi:hypothetical protein